jgi:hypothetical protein
MESAEEACPAEGAGRIVGEEGRMEEGVVGATVLLAAEDEATVIVSGAEEEEVVVMAMGAVEGGTSVEVEVGRLLAGRTGKGPVKAIRSPPLHSFTLQSPPFIELSPLSCSYDQKKNVIGFQEIRCFPGSSFSHPIVSPSLIPFTKQEERRMRKHVSHKLGLTLSIANECPLANEEVERLLCVSVVELLALGGAPAKHMMQVEEGRDPSKPHPHCLVAAAMNAQYFASVLLTTPNADLEAQLHYPPGLYESWEVDLLQAVIAFIVRFDFIEALHHSMAALRRTPHNIFVARFLFLMAYYVADYETMAETLGALCDLYRRIIEDKSVQHPERVEFATLVLPYITQLVAFAHQECRRLDVALQLTRESQRQVDELRKANVLLDGVPLSHPYMSHTLCHIFLDQPEQILKELADTAYLWDTENLLACHVMWHRTLALLDLRRIDDALQSYDEMVKKWVQPQTLDLFALCDCVGFLWRCYVEGILPSNDRRMIELSEQWAFHATKQTTGAVVSGVPRMAHIPFIDVHYRCAQLLQAGLGPESAKEVKEAAAQEFAALNSSNDPARALRSVALRFLESAIASIDGSPTKAFDVLAQKREEGYYQGMGGSEAQRGLLEMALVFYVQQSKVAGAADATPVKEKLMKKYKVLSASTFVPREKSAFNRLQEL